ncbi:MAG: RHS repeat-associated core domain-containing protein [Blastocatellia bacterium]
MNIPFLDAYERDSETGLDFAQARYFSNVQGRFTSVDPLLESAELDEPQSWNRYSFVLNNPLVYTDPTGEKWAVQYANGQATFRWYDGDTIPGDWGGKWEEYKAGWYIGADAAIRLGSSAKDAFVLTKDLFSNEDWAKLQGANPTNFTDEQKSILYSGALQRIDQTNFGRKQKALMEAGAYVIAMALSGRSQESQQTPIQASTPVGRLGRPMTVAPGTNAPATIGGRRYTGHALDQMQGRGLTPSVVEDTIARGAKTPGRGGATIYTTEQARVILNPNGSVKTAMPYSKK